MVHNHLLPKTLPCRRAGRRKPMMLPSSKMSKTTSTSSSMPPWMSTRPASRRPFRRCLGCRRLLWSGPLWQRKLKSKVCCLFRPVCQGRRMVDGGSLLLPGDLVLVSGV